MKLTSKGQVTIPQKFRRRYGLLEHTEVEFTAVAGGVLIKPVMEPRLKRLKAKLRGLRGSADAGMSTADILAQTRGDE